MQCMQWQSFIATINPYAIRYGIITVYMQKKGVLMKRYKISLTFLVVMSLIICILKKKSIIC